MPSSYRQSCPKLFKDSSGNISVHHNHYASINYNSYGCCSKNELSQTIDQEKVSLKGCIAFFKTFAEDKASDPAIRAAAACALEEDKARLESCEQHKPLCCAIL